MGELGAVAIESVSLGKTWLGPVCWVTNWEVIGSESLVWLVSGLHDQREAATPTHINIFFMCQSYFSAGKDGTLFSYLGGCVAEKCGWKIGNASLGSYLCIILFYLNINLKWQEYLPDPKH